jgi:hypothetical protein
MFHGNAAQCTIQASGEVARNIAGDLPRTYAESLKQRRAAQAEESNRGIEDTEFDVPIRFRA